VQSEVKAMQILLFKYESFMHHDNILQGQPMNQDVYLEVMRQIHNPIHHQELQSGGIQQEIYCDMHLPIHCTVLHDSF
jgi:hypothetical protein